MKTLALAIAVVLLDAAPPQDDADAKKKRLGEIMSQMNKLQVEAEKLMKDLTGGNREKQDALMRELMEKYAPEMAAGVERAQTASRERSASATLKSLAAAEADFRANDRDWNHVNDFWVADVSGLWRVNGPQGPMKLIEMAVGVADARPALPLDKEGPLPTEPKTKLSLLGKPSPKYGYLYVAIEKCHDDDGKIAKYDQGGGRNTSRFGFCAYPAEYGKTGKMTFAIDENNTVFRKDTGGKPVDLWPADPVKAGWERVE